MTKRMKIIFRDENEITLEVTEEMCNNNIDNFKIGRVLHIVDIQNTHLLVYPEEIRCIRVM